MPFFFTPFEILFAGHALIRIRGNIPEIPDSSVASSADQYYHTILFIRFHGFCTIFVIFFHTGGIRILSYLY